MSTENNEARARELLKRLVKQPIAEGVMVMI